MSTTLRLIILLIYHCECSVVRRTINALKAGIVLHPISEYREGRTYVSGFPIGYTATDVFPYVAKVTFTRKNVPNLWQRYGRDVFDASEQIMQSFRVMQEMLLKSICTQDDGSHWGCCDLSQIGNPCDRLPTSAVEIMTLFGNIKTRFGIIFLYNWCMSAWRYYNLLQDEQSRVKKEIDTFCPDPCLRNPCAGTLGIDENIGCIAFGSFSDEYRCACLSNFDWDKGKMTCLPQNPCYRDDFPLCVGENAISCAPLNSEQVVCVCKEKYMGEDCSLLVDPCQQRLNKSLDSGNKNCNIQAGNICLPQLGTDAYQCQCTNGYRPSLDQHEDNCLARRDPCSEDPVSIGGQPGPNDLIGLHITCLNGGRCVSSGDYTRVACLCPKHLDGTPLFEGKNCEIPMGVWSGWSKYSRCLPKTCSDMRYRWRQRVCLNSTESGSSLNVPYAVTIDCPGASQEVVPCPSTQPCEVIRQQTEYMIDQISLFFFTFLTIIQMAMTILIWLCFRSFLAQPLPLSSSESSSTTSDEDSSSSSL